MEHQDGLIGADIFDAFVVTLDFPREKVRLEPLPARPDETNPGKKSRDTEPNAETEAIAGDPVEGIVYHNRYIAPEMKEWTKMYRVGHEILLPVTIGKTRSKLFLVDTGASSVSISPAAAREVAKIHADAFFDIEGLSGAVSRTFVANGFKLEFAHLAINPEAVLAYDMTSISHEDGIEVSGFLGWPVLRFTSMHIDYRDNLIKLEYNPNAPQ